MSNLISSVWDAVMGDPEKTTLVRLLVSRGIAEKDAKEAVGKCPRLMNEPNKPLLLHHLIEKGEKEEEVVTSLLAANGDIAGTYAWLDQAFGKPRRAKIQKLTVGGVISEKDAKKALELADWDEGKALKVLRKWYETAAENASREKEEAERRQEISERALEFIRGKKRTTDPSTISSKKRRRLNNGEHEKKESDDDVQFTTNEEPKPDDEYHSSDDEAIMEMEEPERKRTPRTTSDRPRRASGTPQSKSTPARVVRKGKRPVAASGSMKNASGSTKKAAAAATTVASTNKATAPATTTEVVPQTSAPKSKVSNANKKKTQDLAREIVKGSKDMTMPKSFYGRLKSIDRKDEDAKIITQLKSLKEEYGRGGVPTLLNHLMGNPSEVHSALTAMTIALSGKGVEV